VGNILQQLYGTVDTLVVGNFCDSAALAAVGTATQPMEILLCVFLGIGNGASILVSQEMGRRNADGLRMLVRTAVWFLYLCAIPVTILAMFVGPALLRLMQVPADAFDYAVLYLRITALGTLGNLGYNMNAGILRGLGDSRSTLLLLLISCLTNIVLDVAFVAVLGMGVAGAALATTIALYLSWLTSILYARRNYEGLQFPLLPHGYDKAQLAAILKVGVPLGLNNSLYSVGHVAVQAVYNMQGSVFVAGCSIAGRVTGIAGIAITSFSSAAVVFAGQNLGAGNYRRLQRGVVQITCAAGVVTLLIGLVATVFCRPLLGLFSSDPAVLDAAVRYTWWVLPFIWTYAVFNCMMSFVNGTGAVKYTTVVNLLILWAVRIPAAYILHALGYGTSSMACVSLSYAVGLVAMLGYFLTPEWGKLRRKAKELGDAVTAETEPTL
jgi:putative MATE family efflux protein